MASGLLEAPRDIVCVQGMGSAAGVDAVSLSLLLWAEGVSVPWEEGPCHLSRSPCTFICAFTCVHASVYVPMYECVWKPRVGTGCLPDPSFVVEAESLDEPRAQFDIGAQFDMGA